MNLRLQELVKGQTFSHNFMISESDMAGFQRMTGDNSLIHTDSNFSQNHHFEKPIVYGALILAHLSGFLGTKIPGAHGLSVGWNIQFIKPLYTEEHARIEAIIHHVSLSTRLITLNFNVLRREEILAKGKVETLMLE
jgi:acyl dehydratase